MCGRFTLGIADDDVAEYFAATKEQPFGQSYNIAPTQTVPAVLVDDGRRVVRLHRWGLVPSWSREIAGPPLFNARAETVATKPAFRTAFARRRCLVPATGFYEWKVEGKVKVPHYIHLRDGGLFAFAGLWEEWTSPDGSPLRSCTIVTTTPNALMSTLHDRMPVILAPERQALWLDPAAPRDRLQAMLVPWPDADLEEYPVARLRPGADGPDLVARV